MKKIITLATIAITIVIFTIFVACIAEEDVIITDNITSTNDADDLYVVRFELFNPVGEAVCITLKEGILYYEVIEDSIIYLIPENSSEKIKVGEVWKGNVSYPSALTIIRN